MTSVAESLPITRYRCERCGDWFETTAVPFLRTEDAPGDEPVRLGPFTRCAKWECAWDNGQPDVDTHRREQARRAQGIREDATVYLHYFAGEDIDVRMSGYQLEAHCVAVSSLPRTPWGAPHPHPFVYQFKGVANPAVVICWVIYRPICWADWDADRPNRAADLPPPNAYLFVWWDARKHKTRYELVGLDTVSPGEANKLARLVWSLRRQGPPRGRPLGSGEYPDRDEFEALIITLVEEIACAGGSASQAVVAGYLDSRRTFAKHRTETTDDRQLRAWIEYHDLNWRAMKAEGLGRAKARQCKAPL